MAFLLLVAPGSIWELERSKFVPGVKESALIELARIALVSLCATGIAVILTFWGFWWPLYRAAEASGVDPLSSSVSSVPYVAAAVVTSVIACLLVYFVSLYRWPAKRSILGIRLWHRHFVTRRPTSLAGPGNVVCKGSDPIIIVELVDGTVWKGPVNGFDSDPDDSHRWLSLTHPMSRKRKDDSAFVRITEKMESVLLPESQIKSIQVGYLPPRSPSEDFGASEPEFRSILGDVKTVGPRLAAWASRRINK
ncbi:hypothetical protein ABIB48_003547 [Arthrobacter sp. UYCu511]